MRHDSATLSISKIERAEVRDGHNASEGARVDVCRMARLAGECFSSPILLILEGLARCKRRLNDSRA
jgi:hypothetical protein